MKTVTQILICLDYSVNHRNKDQVIRCDCRTLDCSSLGCFVLVVTSPSKQRQASEKQHNRPWDRSSLGCALFMTLNVKTSVESSIKNTCLLVSQLWIFVMFTEFILMSVTSVKAFTTTTKGSSAPLLLFGTAPTNGVMLGGNYALVMLVTCTFG